LKAREHGAAVNVNRLADLAPRLESLLESPKLAEMARAAKRLDRPQAAEEICAAAAQRVDGG